MHLCQVLGEYLFCQIHRSEQKMASPPNLPPLQLEQNPLPQLVQDGARISIAVTSPVGEPLTPSPTTLSLALTSPEGIDCYGNERQALFDLAKYYNSEKLSDITLVVSGVKYFAHKLVLIRSSDVFETMLSEEWTSSDKKELELVEEGMCVNVFPRFLKFLYGCHIKLNMENALPVLVLADKYNVQDLRNVCINFACSYIIPKMQLKDVFHVWFQYATKCYHQKLIQSCVKSMATKMDDITASVEWEHEWINLDKEQLIEFLKSSDLTIKDEFELWNAVFKWLVSASHPKRATKFESNLKEILEFIRFPMMTPEQIYEVEGSDIAEEFPHLFHKHFMAAYKYHALPLSSRAIAKEFQGRNFLLRNYTDLRWDKRFVIQRYIDYPKGEELSFRFSTRASSVPTQNWEWELKVYPKGFSATSEDFRVVLYSNLILDQPRPVEFLMSILGRSEILHSVSGKKNFSKTRYTTDTEMDKKVSVIDLCQPNSPLLVDGCLVLQISIKPVE